MKEDFDLRFGDIKEAIRAATMERQAVNLAEAKSATAAFVGSALRNESTGFEAVVSNKSISKMLSESAIRKSTSAEAHSQAVANIDRLFLKGELLESKPDERGDMNLKAIHRFFSPMIHKGDVLAVKITVKESSNPGTSHRIYTVEAMDVEKMKPARNWTTDATESGVVRHAPHASFVDKMHWLAAKVKLSRRISNDVGGKSDWDQVSPGRNYELRNVEGGGLKIGPEASRQKTRRQWGEGQDTGRKHHG